MSYAIKFISVEAPSCQAVCFIIKKCLTPFDAHSIIAKSSSHSIMNARSILWAFFFISFSPSIAYAIPNQHLNPHPDDPGKISWQQKPGNPDDINHLHIEGVKISILPESGTNHDKTWGFTHDNGKWGAEAAWDDRFLRYEDTAMGIGPNGAWDHFGHGYIDPSFRPRYIYANDVPQDAQAQVNEAMSTWNIRAKDEGEKKRTTPDGTPLKTSVIFEKVTSGAHELLVDFMDGFQDVGNAVAEWILSTAQIVGYPVGQVPTPRTLLFEATPTSQFRVSQADWQLSTDGRELGDPLKVYSALSSPFATNWSFDKTPNVLFDDLDFDYLAPDGITEYEGDEKVFKDLGISITDEWGGYPALAAKSTIDIYEADFFSIALHEWGHVIGLIHSNGGIMKADAPFTMNFTSQAIDADNAYGAAALYSIPVPGPLPILGIGSAFAYSRKIRKRMKQSPLDQIVKE